MAGLVGQTVSHNRIVEQISKGGMGVGFLAEDTRLRRTVALKFLLHEVTDDPRAKERFIHEAQAASALQHANICVVHDIDETPDGQLFIVMEHLQGETLETRIERGPLRIEESIDIAIGAILLKPVLFDESLVSEPKPVAVITFNLRRFLNRTVYVTMRSLNANGFWISGRMPRTTGRNSKRRENTWNTFALLGAVRIAPDDRCPALMTTIGPADPLLSRRSPFSQTLLIQCSSRRALPFRNFSMPKFESMRTAPHG